jgi:hypothetical protein
MALSFSTWACRLGFGNALKLAPAAKIGSELREHAEHVEEALTSRRTGVDRLRCSPRGSRYVRVLFEPPTTTKRLGGRSQH